MHENVLKAEENLEKIAILHEQEMIKKNREITQIENKYFEFESRLFEGVGHGLRVKDSEKK
jgi:hypothetical protein